MNINCVTFKSLWLDRVPGASNIIAKNPINNLSGMGKLEELASQVDEGILGLLYDHLKSLGLPNNYSGDFISGAEGLTLIGPTGVIPFRLVTANQSVSAGSTVDGPDNVAIEYADTKTITNAFNSIEPEFSASAILAANNAFVGNTKNTSSVSAQNTYQDAPSTIVKKGKTATANFRLNITGNLLRNFTRLCKRVGASTVVGGFTWDSAAADAELPIVLDASCQASVMTQWQINVDDNLISAALSQTGRIYAVFGATTVLYANPSVTGSACASPKRYIIGTRPTICCAIDITNSKQYFGSVQLQDFAATPLADLDLSFIGGVQVNNDIPPPLFF